MRLFTCLLIFILFVSCKKEQEKTNPRLMPLTEAVYASGKLKPYNEYKVYASVAGILKGEFVSENDLVHPGDVVAEIESDISKLKVDNAETILMQAKRNSAPDSPILLELKSQLESARFKMEDDSINLVRYTNLLKQNVGTKAEVERRELLYKTSQNNYIAAQKRLINTKEQLETEYKNALNNFKVNAESRNNYRIRSMIEGKVYAFYKEPGEMVSLQEPLALLGHKDRFIIALTIDELDINKVKMGQKVLVTTDTYGDKVFESKITKILPLLDERTQTFDVEAEFIDMPERLYPGLSVEANIIIREKPNALVIPRSFLLPGDSVMIKEEKRKVQTGLKNLEYVEIISGLDSTEVVYK
jgi:HlyD family secretion protein